MRLKRGSIQGNETVVADANFTVIPLPPSPSIECAKCTYFMKLRNFNISVTEFMNILCCVAGVTLQSSMSNANLPTSSH